MQGTLEPSVKHRLPSLAAHVKSEGGVSTAVLAGCASPCLPNADTLWVPITRPITATDTTRPSPIIRLITLLLCARLRGQSRVTTTVQPRAVHPTCRRNRAGRPLKAPRRGAVRRRTSTPDEDRRSSTTADRPSRAELDDRDIWQRQRGTYLTGWLDYVSGLEADDGEDQGSRHGLVGDRRGGLRVSGCDASGAEQGWRTVDGADERTLRRVDRCVGRGRTQAGRRDGEPAPDPVRSLGV